MWRERRESEDGWGGRLRPAKKKQKKGEGALGRTEGGEEGVGGQEEEEREGRGGRAFQGRPSRRDKGSKG